MQAIFDSNVEYPQHYTPIDPFHQNPIQLLIDWIHLAKQFPIPDYNAMTLATYSPTQPNCRIVLAKRIVGDSIEFFSHYQSPKGIEILHQKKVAILFYWHALCLQVRGWGPCSPVSAEISNAYFASRPRLAQLGAWASQQSKQLHHPQEWDIALEKQNQTFPTIVPRPPHWGGFSIILDKIEFWQGKKNRFHHRVLFSKPDHCWLPGKILFP